MSWLLPSFEADVRSMLTAGRSTGEIIITGLTRGAGKGHFEWDGELPEIR